MPKSSSSETVVRDVAYIALGSNLGDRSAHLKAARRALAMLPVSRVVGQSSIEETAPIGPVRQDPFLNQMIVLETELDPRALLDALHGIEKAAGRTREARWGPRTLDLDIVLLQRQSVADPRLTVPHPELCRRAFWQRELAELGALP